MSLQKGQKVKLEDEVINKQFIVNVNVKSTFPIDVSCFGLDANEKLSDDAYMIFYNQKASPLNEIQLLSDVPNSQFSVNLSALPSHITKLVFTAAIDPSSQETMNKINELNFTMNGLDFSLSGQDFNQEKAVMIAEIYKKENVWRLGVNGQGFNGGLDALLVHFGGEVASSSEATNAPLSPAKISLEKRFEDKAPQLVSLAKKASISLEKYNLSTVKAKTAFVIDASGSMMGQYNSGQVQETLNRVFPLGVHFDDDEELETWAFANQSKKLSNITFNNYKDYVSKENRGWQNWMSELNSSYNNEPVVITEVIKYFTGLTPSNFKGENYIKKSKGIFGFGQKEELNITDTEIYAPKIDDKTPIFIIFISDGGVDHNAHIEHLIKWSSTLPIFWQFVGIGGYGYGALEKLDNLEGRYIDNANFFAIDDLKQISESELYDRMVNEFPKWLKEAHAKGIINDYTITDASRPKNKI